MQTARHTNAGWSNYLDWESEQVSSQRSTEQAARQAWGKWLPTLADWDLFATLTYDPARHPLGGWPSQETIRKPSDNASKRHVERWLEDSAKALGRPLQAVCVLEHHVSGWPHWHGLLALGGLAGGDVKRLWSNWFEQHGYIRLEVPRDKAPGDRDEVALKGAIEPRGRLRVAEYCAKYIVKADGLAVIRIANERAVQLVLDALRRAPRHPSHQ